MFSLGRSSPVPAALLLLWVLACGNASSPLTVDTAPRTVGLTLGSNSVTTAGDLAISATASDAVGVTRVEFYERIAGIDAAPTKIGEDASEPYQLQRPVLVDIRWDVFRELLRPFPPVYW